MIKTVFVDVDNTLLDFHACARKSLQLAYAEQGVECTEELCAIFDRVNNGLWLELEQGKLTRDELYRVRFTRVFAAQGLELDGPAFETRFRHHLEHVAEPVDGAKELLTYLAGKYSVCVASNAPHNQQYQRLELAGMLPLVEHLFVSMDLGFEKPQRGFFEGCFAALPDAKPEESIMIGDSLTADIRGALDFGMKACWFNPKGAPVPEDLRPDYVVQSLREICGIL